MLAALSNGRRFRALAVVDNFTRKCLSLVVDTSLSSLRVGRKLDRTIEQRGKPLRNGFMESFNGQLRDECLNEHLFGSLAAARQIIEAWRIDYNIERPHLSLDMLTPAAL